MCPCFSRPLISFSCCPMRLASPHPVGSPPPPVQRAAAFDRSSASCVSPLPFLRVRRPFGGSESRPRRRLFEREAELVSPAPPRRPGFEPEIFEIAQNHFASL